MSSNTHQLAKNELLQAIAYFVKRQKLVEQAMLDFNLDLDDMKKWGALAWTVDIAKISETLAETPSDLHGMVTRAINRDYKTVPQSGVWKDADGQEWDYFMHGGGCRLTHKITRELIDWDPPNTSHFDPWKFRFHLIWQLKAFGEKYPNLKRLVDENTSKYPADKEFIYTDEIVMKLINELISDGLINPDHTLV